MSDITLGSNERTNLADQLADAIAQAGGIVRGIANTLTVRNNTPVNTTPVITYRQPGVRGLRTIVVPEDPQRLQLAKAYVKRNLGGLAK